MKRIRYSPSGIGPSDDFSATDPDRLEQAQKSMANAREKTILTLSGSHIVDVMVDAEGETVKSIVINQTL
jgi:hypothetical protein